MENGLHEFEWITNYGFMTKVRKAQTRLYVHRISRYTKLVNDATILHFFLLSLSYLLLQRKAEGLLLEPRGKFFKGYDPDVSPAIINSFSTAALRMGHSLVRGDFRLPVFGVPRRRQPELDVSDFFNPSPLYEPIRGQNPYGLIIRGLRLDSMRRVDQ